MKIAIVGAGVAGLTAAYLLNRAHDIELFERNDYAGGHANTVLADAGGHAVGLDTGFIVYNEHTYPGFVRLLDELQVASKPGQMSLSVRCRACRMCYSSRGLGGMLADRANALRPARVMLALDMLRFFRDTRRTMASGGFEEATLGEYVRARRYGGEFVRHFLVPLAAAVWSTPSGAIERFPARYFLQFVLNHGIIGLQPAYVWRTVQGGSQAYVRAITSTFPCRTRLSTPVRSIRRHADGVCLALGDGTSRRFDAVVLACHADEALALLDDASEDERRALGGFAYTSNRVVLHTDASLLPRHARVRSSWNYYTDGCRRSDAPLHMTFHLNQLQALDEGTDYCVSLNAAGIAPATILREMTYEHPSYTFETLAAQGAVARINGERRTFFAGAHLGYGFHEDGVQSGVRVASMLGVEW